MSTFSTFSANKWHEWDARSVYQFELAINSRALFSTSNNLILKPQTHMALCNDTEMADKWSSMLLWGIGSFILNSIRMSALFCAHSYLELLWKVKSRPHLPAVLWALAFLSIIFSVAVCRSLLGVEIWPPSLSPWFPSVRRAPQTASSRVFLGFPGCRSGFFLWGLSLHKTSEINQEPAKLWGGGGWHGEW